MAEPLKPSDLFYSYDTLTTNDGRTINGLVTVTLRPSVDERGHFMKTYDTAELERVGLHRPWAEENESFNIHKGTVRGIHLQLPPYTQAKFLRVTTGEVLFSAVDLREGSETFGAWGQAVVSAAKSNMLFVPRGFGLSMCTLTDDCRLLYKVDNVYAPQHGVEIKWNDPELGIVWPVAEPAAISQKDANAMSFSDFKERHGSLPF